MHSNLARMVLLGRPQDRLVFAAEKATPQPTVVFGGARAIRPIATCLVVVRSFVASFRDGAARGDRVTTSKTLVDKV